jgi:hypothetical protein
VVATVGASENDPAVALEIPNEGDPYGADNDDAHFVEEPKGEGEDPIVGVIPNGVDVGVVLATKGVKPELNAGISVLLSNGSGAAVPDLNEIPLVDPLPNAGVDGVDAFWYPSGSLPDVAIVAGAPVENGAGAADGIAEPNIKVLAGVATGMEAAVSIEVSILGFSLVATGMDASVSVEVPVVGFALDATAKGLKKAAPKLNLPTAGADVVEVILLSAGVLWVRDFFDLSLFTAFTNSRLSKNDFVDIP